MRFTLASMAAPGTDIVLSEERILSYRAFANKIWNAARFVFMNLDKYESEGGETLDELASPMTREGAPYAYSAAGELNPEIALIDLWIFSRLARATTQVNEALEHFRFHEAAHLVYHFFWGDFCDWYIEWVKPELVSADRTKAAATWKNLFAVFESALRLLHPFMPFLTEELWHQLPQREGARSIALDRFPAPPPERLNQTAEDRIATMQEIITGARNIRAEMKLDPKAKLPAQITGTDLVKTLVLDNIDTISRLAGLSALSFAATHFDATKGAVRTGKDFELFIPYEAAFDVQAEKLRLQKELDRLTKDIASKQSRLQDDTFRSRAPEHIVKGLETTLAERRTEFSKLGERLAQLERL
jgi:valyl-tRNA synthetase